MSRAQLEARGLGRHAIAHRVARGRLHRVWPGVFAVGRPELTREGRWMAAVLSCGAGAVLSHRSAGELWGILQPRPGPVTLSVPAVRSPKRREGIRVHRRRALEGTSRLGIPVTAPAQTLIDLAATLEARRLEAAVNQADKLDLIDLDALRASLDAPGAPPGVRALRELLDRDTFALTDSDLERRFLRLAADAGLPRPATQAAVGGFRVDFHWPQLRLVVETDGLRYHRTPAQQAADRRRDQALTAAGLTVLRFTHGQVARERAWVTGALRAVAG